jgi:hypothetical protein
MLPDAVAGIRNGISQSLFAVHCEYCYIKSDRPIGKDSHVQRNTVVTPIVIVIASDRAQQGQFGEVFIHLHYLTATGASFCR